MLPTSPSSDSLASTRSSTSPGTPSSVDNYQTISTTSTVTTRRRKLRRPTFEPRTSRLDPETMTKNQDPFRGFHTLFWIVMGAYGLITFDEEWTRVGKAFGGTLFSSFSQDAIILAISDFGLVFSTGFAFVLVKMFAKGWMRYMVSGMVVQHCLQLVFLLTAIAWTIWRDWPWVQSGFFTLHCITMLMKVHSYIAYNGELSEKKIQLKKIESAYAQMKRNDIQIMDDNDMDASAVAGNTDNDTSNDNHIDDLPTNDPVQEQEVYRRRHHRLASEAAAALLQDPAANPSGFDASMLASEVDELKNELRCQNGELWPANVTVANFVDYLLVPSLIYELQYPRTTRIRPMYVFEKSVATLGTFTLLYLTTEHYIYPVVFDPTISPMRAVVLLMIPFMMNYLMIFYIIFECICNAFAEISRFADRSFYEDWWNCVGFDEWARKWNKPVHHFLLRHVYDSSIESFHLSKKNAAFATFFLSSCVHELVMMVVTRKVRLYLFALQMFQLPLIWAGNIKLIRERPRLANAVFWLGMFCGPPLLGVAYCYA
ncbi:MBOAT, membrane-bound O-acyltransferase family-domain-containing protein [Gamsiella multidivaricata]|uniref:MBOAT, membrane-bound O-acyltransferase family-domain-containing protein n=1 Tax=Gamsiella multidivaricata TaxID=101098 RepID=UPI00221E7E63|nr:MBOAT, membrane-bound O-acyltransferase family-domain-containing protein [Gamsiella multidivaricata]KAI7819920.1 MBOAT, membrane-bound O-acyltransferase family-domain-containing protein [Gamsiella multidivaricata]